MSSILASVDEAPVKHLHLKERSSIPSVLRGADAFTITRMESSNGLAERITKVSSVPALLVAVSIGSAFVLLRGTLRLRPTESIRETIAVEPLQSLEAILRD